MICTNTGAVTTISISYWTTFNITQIVKSGSEHNFLSHFLMFTHTNSWSFLTSFFFAGNNILFVFLCLDVWVWIALNWDDKNIYTSPLSGSGSDENGGVFSVAHHKNMNIITFYTTNVLGNKYFPTIQTQTLHIIYRFGSRIDEQSGGREKDICYRTLILVKDSEVSSMVWCSPSPRTVSLPMVTLDTTTGLPRFLHLLYPRVSPGVSTLLWCTTSQGELIIFHIVLRP